MLKIGDKIKIHSVPDGFIHSDTVDVYKKLIERNRSVKINKIDEKGVCWYSCRFKVNGRWEYHDLTVLDSETNWIKV